MQQRKYHTCVVVIGGIIIVLPFLGFSVTWEKIIFIVCGISLVIVGMLIRQESRQQNSLPSKPKEKQTATPSTPPPGESDNEE